MVRSSSPKINRPKTLPSVTYREKVACGTLYVTITSYEDEPFEIFIAMGKVGGCISTLNSILARVMSIALRSGTDIEKLLDQLDNQSCPNSSPVAGSCPQGVANAIRRFLNDKRDKLVCG